MTEVPTPNMTEYRRGSEQHALQLHEALAPATALLSVLADEVDADIKIVINKPDGTSVTVAELHLPTVLANCQAALTAARAPVFEPTWDWQPIDTAPKDGTTIDIRDATTLLRRVRWGLHDSERSPHGAIGWVYGDPAIKPTHWSPSPVINYEALSAEINYRASLIYYAYAKRARGHVLATSFAYDGHDPWEKLPMSFRRNHIDESIATFALTPL